MSFPRHETGVSGLVIPNLLDIASKQYQDAITLYHLARFFGPVNTAKAVYTWQTGANEDADLSLTDEKFDFPVTVGRSLHDFSNYLEISADDVYDLPTELDDEIDGLPIVDVGAYIGLSAVYFASKYRDSKVIAVEPSSRNQRLLQINTAPYGDQIKVLNSALTTEDKIAHNYFFGRRRNSHMANMFATNGIQLDPTGSVGTVAGITVDGLLGHVGDSRLGILKVDIEGAEKALFESDAIKRLLDRTNILMIETHDNFMAGSSEAVESATEASSMVSVDLNSHTDVYIRS